MTVTQNPQGENRCRNPGRIFGAPRSNLSPRAKLQEIFSGRSCSPLLRSCSTLDPAVSWGVAAAQDSSGKPPTEAMSSIPGTVKIYLPERRTSGRPDLRQKAVDSRAVSPDLIFAVVHVPDQLVRWAASARNNGRCFITVRGGPGIGAAGRGGRVPIGPRGRGPTCTRHAPPLLSKRRQKTTSALFGPQLFASSSAGRAASGGVHPDFTFSWNWIVYINMHRFRADFVLAPSSCGGILAGRFQSGPEGGQNIGLSRGRQSVFALGHVPVLIGA